MGHAAQRKSGVAMRDYYIGIHFRVLKHLFSLLQFLSFHAAGLWDARGQVTFGKQ